MTVQISYSKTILVYLKSRLAYLVSILLVMLEQRGYLYSLALFIHTGIRIDIVTDQLAQGQHWLSPSRLASHMTSRTSI
jgi:hypothetical protein